MSYLKKFLPSPLCTICLILGFISALLASELGEMLLKKRNDPNYVSNFSIDFFMGAFSPFIVILDVGGTSAWISAVTIFFVPACSILLLRKNGNLVEPLIVLIFPALTASMLATNTWTSVAAGLGGILSPLVVAVFIIFTFMNHAKRGIKEELGIGAGKSK